MSETFSFAFKAISPMVLLMALGWWGKRVGFLDHHTLNKLNSFIFKTGIPALMFCNVYALDDLSDISIPLVIFVLISLVIITLVGIGLAYVFSDLIYQRGVMIQAAFRSNFAIIGASLSLALGGTAGNIVATSLQAPSILYFNIAAVVFLTYYSTQEVRKVNLLGLLRSILTNPLVIAQLMGVVCLIIRTIIPVDQEGNLIFSLSGSLPWFYAFLNSLSAMASPLVLILLGAQIDLTKVGSLKKQLISGIIMRLIGTPALGFFLAIAANKMGLLQINPAVISALIALYGSPAPAAGAVMAEQMGGDGELARQYVAWTNVLSVITLFVWVLIFRTIGCL